MGGGGEFMSGALAGELHVCRRGSREFWVELGPPDPPAI